jgi:hypothetical protein
LQKSDRTPTDGTRSGVTARYGPAGSVARPGLVRLLFLWVVLYFIAGVTIRKGIRPIYPALTMPAFSGIGLGKMTADEGETTQIRIFVRFADQSTVEVPRAELLGNDFFPSVLPVKFVTVGRGSDKNGPLPEDATQFLAVRLEKLFPGKSVAAVTFQVLRVAFPLDRPNDRKIVGVVQERVIPFTP